MDTLLYSPSPGVYSTPVSNTVGKQTRKKGDEGKRKVLFQTPESSERKTRLSVAEKDSRKGVTKGNAARKRASMPSTAKGKPSKESIETGEGSKESSKIATAHTPITPLPLTNILILETPLIEVYITEEDVSSTDHLGAAQLLSLLRLLGNAFRLLCTYRCQESIALFQKIPPVHYNTGWVLSQIGRAYYEMIDYHEVRAKGICNSM